MAQSNAERQKTYRERNASNAPTRERAPRRTTRAPSVAALKKDAAGILILANNFAYAFGFAADALDDSEIDMLANGIAHELHQHPEWVKKLSQMMSGVSAHGVLAAAVLAIALPRLSRRGVVPWTVAQPLYGVAAMVAGSTPTAHEPAQQPTTYPSLPVEAEPAPRPSGGQREWEVDTSGEVTG